MFFIEINIYRSRQNKITIDTFFFDEMFHCQDVLGFEASEGCGLRRSVLVAVF